jgi:CheY-like chemotaxis protein
MTTRPTDKVTVAVVDDSGDMRELLRITLSLADCFQVVGEASNGREAIQLAESLRPDLMLLDNHMPVLPGLDALRTVLDVSPSTEVVLYTADPDRRVHEEALLAGALAVIEKSDVTLGFVDVLLRTWHTRPSGRALGDAGESDRRGAPRYPANLIAALEPLGVSEAALRCIAEELSLGGARLAVEDPSDVPEDVRILIESAAGMLIVAHAQVVAVVRNEGEEPDHARVRFLEMTSANEQRLTEVLALLATRGGARPD